MAKHTAGGCQKKVLPVWNDIVKPLNDQAMFWHSVWNSNGCPPNGELFEVRKVARSSYHSAVKSVTKNADKHMSEKLAEVFIENNTRDFWKEVQKIKGSKRRLSTVITVDDSVGDNEINNLFDKYNNLFNMM